MTTIAINLVENKISGTKSGFALVIGVTFLILTLITVSMFMLPYIHLPV